MARPTREQQNYHLFYSDDFEALTFDKKIINSLTQLKKLHKLSPKISHTIKYHFKINWLQT